MKRTQGIKSFLIKLLKNQTFKQLMRIKEGYIVLQDQGETYYFGEPASKMRVVINIHNSLRTYSSFVFGGSFGASESYVRGDWGCDNLTNLVAIMIANKDLFFDLEKGLASFTRLFRVSKHFITRNPIKKSRENVLFHYDLGNDFFSLFLDDTKMYSCALFEDDYESLTTAQKNKLSYICDQLSLNCDDHLLEIGCGWGSLAIFAAENYGCKVTATTVSDLQYDYVEKKVKRLKLEDKITLLKKDYRQLKGHYDKLVSIEMIESIGYRYFKKFFFKCNSLLKEGGMFFLQSITICNDQYNRYKYDIDFIKAYIFPGGCLPSCDIISNIVERKTNMKIKRIQDIGESYVKTLECWKDQFCINKDSIKQLGFSDQFIRMFYFYFCYCQAGFLSKYLGNVQLLMVKK